MYSIVMLAAMTGAPETPDFCCKKGGGCYGSYGGGYGYGGGCCFCGCLCKLLCCCCDKGGYGYGGCYGDYGYGGYGYYGGYGVGGGAGVYVGFNAPPANNEAEVIVHAPADAKLFANGQPTDLTGTERVFRTPALTPGQDFNYVMRIEYTANGETKSAKKQITVRANHRTVVDFRERTTSAVTVSLPPNSRLTVDGIDTRMTGGMHTFQTPELSKGQPISYEFRAEIERDGKIEVRTQKVSFRAGEPVEIDFIEAAERRVAK